MCQTGRFWISRPAKKGGKSVKGKKNSNADVMYICVFMCVMYRCYVVYLYSGEKSP
jgi:hypothetical protein